MAAGGGVWGRVGVVPPGGGVSGIAPAPPLYSLLLRFLLNLLDPGPHCHCGLGALGSGDCETLLPTVRPASWHRLPWPLLPYELDPLVLAPGLRILMVHSLLLRPNQGGLPCSRPPEPLLS